jgi:hypothetical protein
VTEVLINPIIQSRTLYFRHTYHPTRSKIYMIWGSHRGSYDDLYCDVLVLYATKMMRSTSGGCFDVTVLARHKYATISYGI